MTTMDVTQLRRRMEDKGYTLASLARGLGIPAERLRTYLGCPEKMPYRTIERLARLLCDSSWEAVQIFFSNNLHNT